MYFQFGFKKNYMKKIDNRSSARPLASLFVRTAAAITALLAPTTVLAQKPEATSYADSTRGVAPLVQEVMPAVADIKVSFEKVGYTGFGSGFTVAPNGYIITNFHVVNINTHGEISEKSLPPNTPVEKVTINFNNGKSYSAKVIAQSDADDLALLKVDASNLPYVTLGDEKDAQIGQSVLAIGGPMGFSFSASTGILSNYVLDDNGKKFLSTDALTYFGNSGGPLFSLDGKVLGVNNRGSIYGFGISNLYSNSRNESAVPADTVKDFILHHQPEIFTPHKTLPQAHDFFASQFSPVPDLIAKVMPGVIGLKCGGAHGVGLAVRSDGYILVSEPLAEACINATKKSVVLAGVERNTSIKYIGSDSNTTDLGLLKIDPPAPLSVIEIAAHIDVGQSILSDEVDGSLLTVSSTIGVRLNH
jgi:S1-C subfamily serine protease